MQALLYFSYHNPPSFIKNDLLNRKKSLKLENSILYMATKSGGSSIIFLFLSEFSVKDYLYIDLKDLLFIDISLESLMCEIDQFVLEENISLVVLEHTPCTIKPVLRDNVSYVLSMDISLADHYVEHLQSFKKQCIYPLDFEEYILFKKNTSDNVFNQFLKDSTFPSIVKNQSPFLHRTLQNILHSYLSDSKEKEIFFLFLKYQDVDISIFQLYNRMRRSTKISKDKFYEKSKLLEKKKLLFLVQKHKEPRANKKIYFLDFNMPKAITITTNIQSSIKNAIFLELLKQDVGISIFYTQELDFYIPNQRRAIVLVIFKELESIKEHIWYLDAMLEFSKDELEYISIITIDEQSSGYIEKIGNIKYEVSTFWEFATR